MSPLARRRRVSHALRLAVLAGLTVGLALSPLEARLGGAGALALAAAGGAALVGGPLPGRWGVLARLALVAMAAALAGYLLGAARLGAIEAGAARGEPGERALATGFVAAPPRRSKGEVRIELETPDGRLLVRAREPVGELEPGVEVRARGSIVEPEPWWQGWLERRGIAIALEAGAVEPTGARRGGIAGGVDAIRGRAEAALGRGMPERQEALGRGFVLGQDDRIDPRTIEDFKRSGLAHLLAVSGQNVVLLCLLGWPLLALAGLPLRSRLLALLGLIALYVPVTGAGPTIQRAGVMGAAGVIAGLSGTQRPRWYALLLAAAVTLALNPRTTGDAGWQLSFAATAGIMLWTRRLAVLLAPESPPGSVRRTLAEGAAVTAAATAATAPLMAHTFDAFPLASLPANLLALPAVAPSMWLGMLAGIAGQLPAIPVEPLNWLNSLLLAYIAQVARWLAAPGWALVELPLAHPVALAGAYAALVAAVEGTLAFARRRRGLRPRALQDDSRRGPAAAARARRRAASTAVAVAVLAGILLLPSIGTGERDGSRGPGSLRVTVIDVGQGDAILLDPPGGAPVLVDAGPGGAAVERDLARLGAGELAAALVSHDDDDHAGGIPEVLASLRVERLGLGRPAPGLRAAALASGAGLVRLAEGSELRSGELRLSVLWPPRELLTAPNADPNRLSLVILAQWRHFSMLLPGDAEAEQIPLDPGAVDVLKVAHHGSEDEGLGPLLDRIVPKLAVISVGSGNSYGHPTAQVLAELEQRSIPTLRTDQAGEIAIEVGERGFSVSSG